MGEEEENKVSNEMFHADDKRENGARQPVNEDCAALLDRREVDVQRQLARLCIDDGSKAVGGKHGAADGCTSSCTKLGGFRI